MWIPTAVPACKDLQVLSVTWLQSKVDIIEVLDLKLLAMSIYEKQMQWKKAAAEKAKKEKVERAADEEYSFTPVIYTNKESSERNRSDPKQKSERSSNRKDIVSIRKERGGPDSDLYSPVRGNASINSHQNSEAGTQSAAGYGSVYSEQHNNRPYEENRNRNSRQLNDHGELDHVDEEDGDNDDNLSNDYSNHRQLQGLGALGRNGKDVQNSEMDNRRHSKSLKHRSNRRESGTSRRPRYSSGSSVGGSTGGEEEEDVDEPIIELLERERRQWREEREKLIQCIHLQQLELSQRSLAAHERAADIAKEFARAIECFEERLVSVEGNVQKEIMSIKSIAESLLHATQVSPQAQSQPALSMINTNYNNNSGGHSGASYSNSSGNSRA